MAAPTIGGVLSCTVNGRRIRVAGEWSYNLGVEERAERVGLDGVHGYTVKPRAPFIEGETSDASDIDLLELLQVTNATITLHLRNGKVIELREAFNASEGTVNAGEGSVPLKFVGMSAAEIRP